VEDVVATVHLPWTREAGYDDEPHEMVRLIIRELRGYARARADQAHIAAEDVPELRQFVERCLPEDPADASDAWVALDLEQLRIAIFVQMLQFCLARLGVGHHRAELQDSELAAADAHPLLSEQDRSR